MAIKENKDILLNYKKYFLICGIFLVLLLALEIFSGLFIQKKSIPDEAWSVTVNGEPTNLTPGKVLIPSLQRGTVITCTAMLTDEGFTYPALVFQSVHGDLTVTSGDKTIYHFNYKLNSQSRMLLDQISLKEADLSQPISLTMVVEEGHSFSSLPNIIYTEERDGFSTFLKSRGFTFIISLFLFFAGTIGTIICSVSVALGKKLAPLIHISQFAFWSSLCIFCHMDFILLFIHNDTINSILELVSFYFAILFACLIIYPKLITTRRHRHIFKVLSLWYVGSCFLFFLLPLCTKMSILDTFSIALVILAAAVVYTIYRCFWEWFKKPERMCYPVTGLITLVFYGVFELLRIFLYSIGVSIFRTPELIILIAGLMIFTASSLIDYLVWFKQSTIQETVEESWKRFSEPNTQPGISGYQKTLALLHELQESKAQYTIITISIDNIEELKLSETPYPLLEDNFARLMYLVFSSYGITGNMGGGKFLAALPDIPEGKVQQLLRAFRVLVQRDNDNHPDAKIQFSEGYALSSDSESEEIVKICQLANNSRLVQEQQLLK